MHAKYLEEPKYQLLIKRREQAGTKNLKDAAAFIECSKYMDCIYNDIEGYNEKRKRKVLMSNKQVQQVLKELFIRCSKLNISLCF